MAVFLLLLLIETSLSDGCTPIKRLGKFTILLHAEEGKYKLTMPTMSKKYLAVGS